MIVVIQDVAINILPNRIKIMDSYKITDRRKMHEIIYSLQYEHHEIKFNRSNENLVNEWVAHNRLYKWGIKPEKTKDVDLEFKEPKLNILVYKILGI